MPPRSSLTSSFSVTDVNNEVVCPLRNQDGSSCRKRCLGVCSHPNYGFATPFAKLSHRFAILKTRVLTSIDYTGEALSLDARAHSKSSPRALYLKASCNRGELSVDDQYPAIRTTTSPTKLQHFSTRYVHHIMFILYASNCAV